MAKKARASRRLTQADRVMELIREGTSLQIEMLGAAARVWSEIVEHVASYNQELTNELLKFSAGRTNANSSLDHLVEEGRRRVRRLEDLPNRISQGFRDNVRQRARAGAPTDR
jgi:hypothetical protein